MRGRLISHPHRGASLQPERLLLTAEEMVIDRHREELIEHVFGRRISLGVALLECSEREIVVPHEVIAVAELRDLVRG